MKPILDFSFIQIPTFYLVISLSLSFVILLMNIELNDKPKIDRTMAFDLVLIIMVSGFLGGRLTHVFYEEFDFYKTFPLEVFKFWKGGFVYFGGFIAAFICTVLYLRFKKENFWAWADFLTPYASLSYAFGRVGCFFEGCCYGSFCEMPWSIGHRHPTQLYMVFAELFLIALLVLLRKFKSHIFAHVGVFFLIWLVGHATCRFIIEFYREDDRGAMINGYSISQWISALFVAAALTTLIFKLKKTTRLELTRKLYNH